MKKKSLLIGAAVLMVLLVVAFFAGGQDKVVPLEEKALTQAVTGTTEPQANVAASIISEDAVTRLREATAIQEAIASQEATVVQEASEASDTSVEAGQAAGKAAGVRDNRAGEDEAEASITDEEATAEEAGTGDVQSEEPHTVPTVSEEPGTIEQTATQENQKPVAEEAGQTQPTQVSEPAAVPVVDPAAGQDSQQAGAAAPQEKDPYLTDPIPDGKPQPVEWQEATVDTSKTFTATLSVSAATILNNLHLFNEDKLEVLPDDGVIYARQTVTFSEGESVFDVLLREMKNSKIHMEFVMTPIYNSHYIEGINNLYEFDCGELSGWMYKVNDWFPNYGASRYQLEAGDDIAWMYTCDLGRDIGGYGATNGR